MRWASAGTLPPSWALELQSQGWGSVSLCWNVGDEDHRKWWQALCYISSPGLLLVPVLALVTWSGHHLSVSQPQLGQGPVIGTAQPGTGSCNSHPFLLNPLACWAIPWKEKGLISRKVWGFSLAPLEEIYRGCLQKPDQPAFQNLLLFLSSYWSVLCLQLSC